MVYIFKEFIMQKLSQTIVQSLSMGLWKLTQRWNQIVLNVYYWLKYETKCKCLTHGFGGVYQINVY